MQPDAIKNTSQENFFRTLIEKLPLEIAIYDQSGRFIFANERTDAFFQKQKGEVQGKSFEELFPKEVADAQYKTLTQVFNSGMPITVERNFMMHGQMNFFRILHQPVFDDDGSFNAVMVIGQNVTDQARQEYLYHIQEQIDSLSNFSTSLPNSLKNAFRSLMKIDWVDAGGVYLFDETRKNLRLVYSEGLSEDYLRKVSVFTSRDKPAKTVLKGISRYTQTRTFLEPIKNVMIKEGLTLAVSIPLKYKKKIIGSLNLGSRNVSEISKQDRMIIESIASRLANLISLVRTREELISANIKLNRSLRDLEVKNQLLIQKSRLESLGELSAGLAHEISQPLSVMSLVMENVNYKLDQDQATKEYLTRKFSTISQNINKIRQLIDHVRLFARGQGIVMYEKIDVNSVIHAALSMIGTQLRNHQINLKLDLSDHGVSVLGNPSRLEQVILNLLSNAMDALDEKEEKTGRVEKEILIKTFRENGRAVIKVKDNGTGISDDILERIFNPFFSTKSEKKGTGLGLAIVYGIVTEMKGEVSIASEVNQFTEVSLHFPGISG